MPLKDLDPKKEYAEVTEELYVYVVTRDNYLCQMCGKIGHDVHHIIFRSQQGKHKANNLILLCNECHTGNFGVHGLTKEVEQQLLKRVERNENRFRQRMI
jgi:5-methylcytosine-specific restriction endonuclease McrA